MLASGVALNPYVTNLVGRYDQVYDSSGVVVLTLWLYVTVLIGTEMNAVLARRAEIRKCVELVQEESPVDDPDT